MTSVPRPAPMPKPFVIPHKWTPEQVAAALAVYTTTTRHETDPLDAWAANRAEELNLDADLIGLALDAFEGAGSLDAHDLAVELVTRMRRDAPAHVFAALASAVLEAAYP